MLPVVNAIQEQAFKPASQARAELESAAVLKQIDDNISSWTAWVRRKLLALMGMDDYEPVDETEVHLLDRATSTFYCTRCVDGSRKHFRPIVLDFAGVCRHQCVGTPRKEGWHFSHFAVDEKVSYDAT